MTRNIAHEAQARDKQVKQAKARIMELPREAAQIVIYFKGASALSCVCHYTDMRKAIKQFDELNRARIAGKEYILRSCTTTQIIPQPQEILTMFLVDQQAYVGMTADNQRRINAMMQLP